MIKRCRAACDSDSVCGSAPGNPVFLAFPFESLLSACLMVPKFRKFWCRELSLNFGSFRESRGIRISKSLVSLGRHVRGRKISEIFDGHVRGHKIVRMFG